MSIRVFHGTGHYVLDAIVAEGLRVFRYEHVSKACACTSLDFKIAQLFAVRKTPGDDFIAGKISGVVLEFEVDGLLEVDYSLVGGFYSLQDESEVVVFSPECLRLVAVWRYGVAGWVRAVR